MNKKEKKDRGDEKTRDVYEDHIHLQKPNSSGPDRQNPHNQWEMIDD